MKFLKYWLMSITVISIFGGIVGAANYYFGQQAAAGALLSLIVSVFGAVVIAMIVEED